MTLKELYVFSVFVGGVKAIVIAPNDQGIMMPLVYNKEDYEREKEQLEARVRSIANSSKLVVELVKYEEAETIQVYYPESTMLH